MFCRFACEYPWWSASLCWRRPSLLAGADESRGLTCPCLADIWRSAAMNDHELFPNILVQRPCSASAGDEREIRRHDFLERHNILVHPQVMIPGVPRRRFCCEQSPGEPSVRGDDPHSAPYLVGTLLIRGESSDFRCTMRHSVQENEARSVEDSSHWFDHRHIEFWDRCIDPAHEPVDMPAEVTAILKRVLAAGDRWEAESNAAGDRVTGLVGLVVGGGV